MELRNSCISKRNRLATLAKDIVDRKMTWFVSRVSTDSQKISSHDHVRFWFHHKLPNQFDLSICKVIRRLETVAHYSFVIVTGTGMPVHQSIAKKGILFQFFIFTAIFFILIMNWKRKQNMIFFSIYSMMLIHIVSPPKYNTECKRQLKRVKSRNINRRNLKKKN